jgi:hypothetical protein
VGNCSSASHVNRTIAHESAWSKIEPYIWAVLLTLADEFQIGSIRSCILATYVPTIPDNTTMASQKKKRSRRRSAKRSAVAPVESRTSEVITIGWTVSLTTVFFCNLATIVAHYYVAAHPEALRMAMLRELLLFAGMVIGLLSLLLLLPVHRLRQTPPPRGLVVFGVCIAIAPIVTVMLRAIR